jgi:SNF2 family DNA or RNA helicase
LHFGLAKGYRYFVINYPGFHTIQPELARVFDSDTILILDESQRVKHHTSRQFKETWKWYQKTQSRYVWLLTGTPTSHSPEDIFGQFAFIDPSIFGHPNNGWYAFRATYTISALGGGARTVIGYKHMDTFMTNLHRKCFRLATEDMYDLPPKQYVPAYVDMPADRMKIYKDFAGKKTTGGDKNQDRGVLKVPGHPKCIPGTDVLYYAQHAFVITEKATQIANGYCYLEDGTTHYFDSTDPDPKMEYIKQLLEDTDQQMIFWYVKEGVRDRIEKTLIEAGESFVSVHGGTKIGAVREGLLEKFRRGEVRCLVGQITTINTGIGLVNCRINVCVEAHTSAAQMQQMEKRTHRLGMDLTVDNVLYYYLLYSNTVEVTRYRHMRRNIELSDIVVDLENLDQILDGTFML